MAIDKKAYALANGYTDETVIGGGAIKGKNCTISKIEDIDGGHRITFGWTLDNGTTKSQTLDVKDGVDGHTPVKGVDYVDGEKGEPGIAGLDGKDGKDGTTYTPSIGEVTTVESNVEASASVSVNTETKEAVFNFAIPKGKDGIDGVQISDNETVENKTWSSSKIASEIPTTLPANGGNSNTVNNHTVKSDVPENAVFTDTIYDDTEIKAEISKKADKSYVDDNFATMDKVDDINSRITDIVSVTPSTDLSTLPKGIFVIQVTNQTFGEVSVLGTCRGVCFNTGIVCHAYVCTSIIDHAYIIAYGQNTWHAFKLV